MNLSIGAIVDACALGQPTRPAATLGEDMITFAELDAAANRCAHVLRSLGIGRGDVVVWWANAALRTLDGFLACARVGAVFAPLNPALTPGEAADVIEYLQPRLIVTDTALSEAAEAISSASGVPLAVFGAGRGPGLLLETLCNTASADPIDVAIDDRDPHIIYLTSGSTGRPKGAVVSHRASWLRAAPGGGTFTTGLRGFGGVVTGFPLFHYGGWHYVLEAWQNRRPIHLVPRATSEELLGAVERWRASALYLIPAMWERVLQAGGVPADLRSLEHADTGTSHTPQALLDAIKNRLPHTSTTVLYGSTEGGRMAALQDWEIAQRPGSVGRPAFPGAVRLSEIGEVCFASPAMMDGYLRLPEETAAALREGVYYSGDVGHFDDDGYLYLTGRTRELIRTGGESVWPVEVEDALRGLPGVRELAVIGIPDPQWGELVCLAVVPQDGCPVPDVDVVHGYLEGRLARFKHPRLVAPTPSIPRTAATGQVQRRLLAETITARP